MDSRIDTMKHKQRVAQMLTETAVTELIRRANAHDDSKLKSPEVEVFDEMTPKLAGSTYGSAEYKSFLEKMKPALDHHYANNSHHPEHHNDGVNGMTLFDVMEMLFDWKAASERHDDGEISRSITANARRFNLSHQLVSILRNTVEALGYSSPSEIERGRAIDWWNEMPMQNLQGVHGWANLVMRYYPEKTSCQGLTDEEILHIYRQEIIK